ncbi:hypothetical protein CVT26_014274 [Gymnopilus dilepis]|uniref:Uncharacterized protein n=1 Tax=Gymnopilus dilepis TaxID=231916 RepID=A0A409VXK8_9AGAR|nr:hypothetical protein CVT26_014274 [Gymnopilus dilepis]
MLALVQGMLVKNPISLVVPNHLEDYLFNRVWFLLPLLCNLITLTQSTKRRTPTSTTTADSPRPWHSDFT